MFDESSIPVVYAPLASKEHEPIFTRFRAQLIELLGTQPEKITKYTGEDGYKNFTETLHFDVNSKISVYVSVVRRE